MFPSLTLVSPRARLLLAILVLLALVALAVVAVAMQAHPGALHTAIQTGKHVPFLADGTPAIQTGKH